MLVESEDGDSVKARTELEREQVIQVYVWAIQKTKRQRILLLRKERQDTGKTQSYRGVYWKRGGTECAMISSVHGNSPTLVPSTHGLEHSNLRLHARTRHQLDFEDDEVVQRVSKARLLFLVNRGINRLKGDY